MTPSIKLIVGLGNPGPRYRDTRHNAGFLVLDELAKRYTLSFRKGKQAEEVRWGALRLIKPLTFMNASGSAVQSTMTKQGLVPEEVLVVHDDLDMPLGRLRFKTGGGAGGQRGVADIRNRIGADFHRLKVGISRPPEGWKVENWVLSRFREDERELLDEVVRQAADSVELMLSEGLNKATNRTNGLDLRPRAETPSEEVADSAGTSDQSLDEDKGPG